MQRENGFWYVQLRGTSKWGLAHWNGKVFTIVSLGDQVFDDESIQRIGNRVMAPSATPDDRAWFVDDELFDLTERHCLDHARDLVKDPSAFAASRLGIALIALFRFYDSFRSMGQSMNLPPPPPSPASDTQTTR